MTFFAPGQVVTTDINYDKVLSGWWLVVHPDFIQHTSFAKKIAGYGFFSYAVYEALHLAEEEEVMLEDIIKKIAIESASPADRFSQDVIISYLELFLNYCNRFYNRQFITRKQAGNDVLSRLEELLNMHFKENGEKGLPTVQYLAGELNLSPKYLSDMLKAVTGRNTQQHIHDKLIEKAKDFLSTTSLSVAEIAYRLGFEHPQSLHKLFRARVDESPLAFRQRFN